MIRVFILMILILPGILLTGQKTYQPVVTEPLPEPWRWKKFPELEKGAFNSMAEENEWNRWFLPDPLLNDKVNDLEIYNVVFVNNSLFIKRKTNR